MNFTMKSIGLSVTLVAAIGSTMLAQKGQAQVITPALPTPQAFVSNLDLACHKVEKGGVTPVRSVVLNQLNPVLKDAGFHAERADLGELEQLCVPVAKNKVMPPKTVLPFVAYTDLACYAAKSPEPQPEAKIALSQLNPVVQKLGLPDHVVHVRGLRQLCTPVAKNGDIPPEYVLRLAQYVDVACYDISVEKDFPLPSLMLENLDPVLRKMGLPSETVDLILPEQLCVPVTKNDWQVPREIIEIVQWVDFEKFQVKTPDPSKLFDLKLTHLNPLFARISPAQSFEVVVGATVHLDLPVAKRLLRQ